MKQKRGFVAALAALATLTVGCAPAEDREKLTPETRALALESFDYVWETVRSKHFDPELGGLDWEGIRDELRPTVETAETRGEARAAVDQMLERLGQSHFQVIPDFVYTELDFDSGGGDLTGVTGIDLRVVDGEALVVGVDDDSPAAEAGITPGFVIERIGDREVEPIVEAISKRFSDSLYLDAALAGAISGRLRGPVGDEVTLRVRDADDETVSVAVSRVAERGETTQIGFLPPVRVWIETRELDSGIAYVRFNAFLDPVQVMTAYNAAMSEHMDAKGLIIDLRGNGGGLPGMAMGMAGWLVPEKGQDLGTMFMRDSELKLIIAPRPRTFDGPVAVLVDGLSGSCSEFMAGGLQSIGRARVFGSQTMGAALPSVIEKLPDGDGFQYAFADFVTNDGVRLEGRGVTPDDEVALSRSDFLAGLDPVIDTATSWILGHSSNGDPAASH